MLKLTRIYFILIMGLAPLLSYGQRTWTGSVSTAWNTAGNWSPSGVPGSGENIIVGTAASGRYPVVADLTVGNWSTGSLTVKDGATLTITGNLTINGNGGNISVQGVSAVVHSGTNFSMPYGGTALTVDGGRFSTSANFPSVTSSIPVSNGGELIFSNGLNKTNSGATIGGATAKIRINGNFSLTGSLTSDSLWYAYASGNSSLTSNAIISTGYLQFSTSGNFSMESASQISAASGSFQVGGAFAGKSNSSFTLGSGNVTVGGNLVMEGPVFAVNSGNVTIGGQVEAKGNNFTVGTGRLEVASHFLLSSGKTFTNSGAYMKIGGSLDIGSSANFSAGSDSLIINRNIVLGSNANFYAGSAKVVVNRATGVSNQISGNWYTQNANVVFQPSNPMNPHLTSISSSGASFRVNQGTVVFNDSVFVGSNASLNADSGTVTFSKSLNVQASGKVNNATGTINFVGNATFSNTGELNAGTGQINIGGDVDFYSSGTINNTSATININGNANFHNSGTLNAGSGELNISGNVTFEGNGGTINANTATISIGGDFNNLGTFNCDSSTVILAGTNSQIISTDVTFFNLIIRTNGTVEAGGNVTVLNSGTIGADAEISIPDNNDQFNVQGDFSDSSGTLAVATNKPFVVDIRVQSATEILVVFNEQITLASAQTTGNYTFNGHSISSALRTDTNKVRLTFSPAIVHDVEYTLVLNNIVNMRSPAGTVTPGHIKRFTWGAILAPTASSSSLVFGNVTENAITAYWTSGNGSGRIVVVKEGSPVTFTPTAGTDYAANPAFGSGADLGSGQYVVYQGSGDSARITGLNSGVAYYIAVYEFNGSGTGTAYYVVPAEASVYTSFPLPTVQASNIVIGYTGPDSMTLSWTNGNGAARMLLARKSNPVDALPVNGATYTGTPGFGAGSLLGTDNYVLYNGTGNTVTIAGLDQNTNYHFTVVEYNGASGSEAYLTAGAPLKAQHTYVRLSVKTMLEGAYDPASGQMRTSLNSILPLQQPYSHPVWNYTGDESVAAIPNADVVDWVLLELRRAVNAETAGSEEIIGRRAAFLLKDGNIVDLDGSSPVRMPTTDYGKIYAVVYHRNHLPLLSVDSLSFSSGSWDFDFTVGAEKAYGADVQTDLEGAYGMYAGKVDYSSPAIDLNDAALTWQNRNSSGVYGYCDVNMDGAVDAADRSLIWNNRNKGRQLPD